MADLTPLPRRYDPESFIIPARDHQGQADRIQCRVQPGLAREVEAIVLSRMFPFRSKGDLMRWGVHTGVKRLRQLEDIGVPSHIHQVEAIMAIVREEEFSLEFSSAFEAADKVIKAHLGNGDVRQARSVVGRIRSEVHKMPDGHWRGKYMQTLLERWGKLLESE